MAERVLQDRAHRACRWRGSIVTGSSRARVSTGQLADARREVALVRDPDELVAGAERADDLGRRGQQGARRGKGRNHDILSLRGQLANQRLGVAGPDAGLGRPNSRRTMLVPSTSETHL